MKEFSFVEATWMAVISFVICASIIWLLLGSSVEYYVYTVIAGLIVGSLYTIIYLLFEAVS